VVTPLINQGPSLSESVVRRKNILNNISNGVIPTQNSQLVQPAIPLLNPIPLVVQEKSNLKIINPVTNRKFQEYHLALVIFNHPLKEFSQPKNSNLNTQNPIGDGLELLPEHPNWRKQIVSIRDQLVFVKSNRSFKNKRTIPIGIMHGITKYDILEDLGNLKADISIKQLLGVAPHCRATLQSKLVRKRGRKMVIPKDNTKRSFTRNKNCDIQYYLLYRFR